MRLFCMPFLGGQRNCCPTGSNQGGHLRCNETPKVRDAWPPHQVFLRPGLRWAVGGVHSQIQHGLPAMSWFWIRLVIPTSLQPGQGVCQVAGTDAASSSLTSSCCTVYLRLFPGRARTLNLCVGVPSNQRHLAGLMYDLLLLARGTVVKCDRQCTLEQGIAHSKRWYHSVTVRSTLIGREC
jgi:hypothetical protein